MAREKEIQEMAEIIAKTKTCDALLLSECIKRKCEKKGEFGCKAYMQAENLQNAGYRKAEEVKKETQLELLNGLLHWVNGAITSSFDLSVKHNGGHYGGKNSAFHEVKDFINKLAKVFGVEVEK